MASYTVHGSSVDAIDAFAGTGASRINIGSFAPAKIQYYLKHPAQSVKIEISDTTGKIIRSFLGGTAAPPPDTTGKGKRP